MKYVISDIHGCYREYMALLEKLCLSEEDHLYILGDAVDRGLNLSNKDLSACDPDDIKDFQMWLEDGGITTAKQYMRLPREERDTIDKWLEKAGAYETVKDGGKTYVLVHAGIAGFKEGVPLEAYDFMDFIHMRTDYDKRYYKDSHMFVITGHTPTPCIRKDQMAMVYEGNGHIAIDCGCVYGGRLAAYCIETGKAVYVDGREAF